MTRLTIVLVLALLAALLTPCAASQSAATAAPATPAPPATAPAAAVSAAGESQPVATAASEPAKVVEPAVGCLPPIKSVAIGATRGLVVNGQPFFPLMNFYQSPKSFANAAAEGLNAYFTPSEKPTPKEYLDALQAKGLYGIVAFQAEAVGHPALLAWLLPHEPDSGFTEGKMKVTPAEVLANYEKVRKADPSRPVVLDFSPAFMSKPDFAKGPTDEAKKTSYAEFAKASDIVTYNVYPIWNYSQPENIYWVAEAARELGAIVEHKKPIFAMIETGKGGRTVPEAEQADVSPEQIKAEVWMAITNGATGIIYFTVQFKPKFSEHNIAPEKQAAIKAINEQITRLAPVILGEAWERGWKGEMTWPGTQPQETKAARDYSMGRKVAEKGGEIGYIFDLNASPRPAKTTIKVDGLKAGAKVEVVDEGRSVTAEAGQFSDDFAPLALHIYRIDLK